MKREGGVREGGMREGGEGGRDDGKIGGKGGGSLSVTFFTTPTRDNENIYKNKNNKMVRYRLF